MKQKLKFRDIEYQTVSPAFRWAENKNYIFVEIKFSHRQDSPGKNILY